MAKDKRLPDKQRDYQVGDKKPPQEHQFKPGQSGNPNGPPKHRTQLWTYFCRYMALTDAELAKLDLSKLTQAEQTALKLVQDAKLGKNSGSERLARHVFDREEGKTIENLVIGTRELSEEELVELLKEQTVPCDDAIAR